jgi:8-hydroxy-5-deazaflavin:NADPH oxidoreductase
MEGGARALRTVGILGAGRFGRVLARLAADAGWRVLLAGSGAPYRVPRVPGTTPVTAREAAAADLVVLALPLAAVGSLDPAMVEGRVVVDATNRWIVPEDDPTGSTSERVQALLPRARVVKALGHVGHADLEDAHAAGLRLGMAIAGDDPDAVAAVAAFVASLGFDPVPAGALAEGIRFEPDTELFGAVADAREAAAMLERFPSSARGRLVARARAAAC